MKNIKTNYKLAILVPMVALLFTNCSKKNVVTVASDDKIIIKDLKDNEERLFVGQTQDQFQFLRAGDTIDVCCFNNLIYKKRRLFTNSSGRIGVSNKSLDIVAVRYVKESMLKEANQR